MIEVNITRDTLAHNIEKTLRSKNVSSGLVGRLIDNLGKDIASKAMVGSELTNRCQHNVDWKGIRVLVSTKKINVYPQQEFDVSVHEIQQDIDYFAFVLIHKSFKKAWILGYLPCLEYVKKSKKFKEGEKNGKFTFQKQAYVAKIKDLRSFS